MQVERMLTVKYAALQGAYWFLAAVGLAFVTPLLEGKGYSGLEIGCLISGATPVFAWMCSWL